MILQNNVRSLYFRPTMRFHCRAAHRDELQRSVERFWYPFMQTRVDLDLSFRRFAANFRDIRTPDNDFTCQVNRIAGGATLIENFFLILLSGFDITSVFFGWKSSLSDSCTSLYSGKYVLVHTKPFLGWEPAESKLVSDPSSVSLAYGTQHSELGGQNVHGYSIQVPFSMHVEGGGSKELLSHISFHSSALDRIAKIPECPESVRRCLANHDAMQMCAALRRASVDPSNITAEALLAAVNDESLSRAIYKK